MSSKRISFNLKENEVFNYVKGTKIVIKGKGKGTPSPPSSPPRPVRPQPPPPPKGKGEKKGPVAQLQTPLAPRRTARRRSLSANAHVRRVLAAGESPKVVNLRGRVLQAEERPKLVPLRGILKIRTNENEPWEAYRTHLRPPRPSSAPAGQDTGNCSSCCEDFELPQPKKRARSQSPGGEARRKRRRVGGDGKRRRSASPRLNKDAGVGVAVVAPDGSKSKFVLNEKVLCFEPDPKKARVLYEAKTATFWDLEDTAMGFQPFEAKVLEVFHDGGRLEQHRTSPFRYKIHFQGWKSTYDRYVWEQYVLKDTPENRALQRKLKDQVARSEQTVKGKKKNRGRGSGKELPKDPPLDVPPVPVAKPKSKGKREEKEKVSGKEKEKVTGKAKGKGIGKEKEKGIVKEKGSVKEKPKSAGNVADPTSTTASKGRRTHIPQNIPSTPEELLPYGMTFENDGLGRVEPLGLLIPSLALKKIMEYDYNQIVNDGKLVKIPCKMTVVDLLERYLHYKVRFELERVNKIVMSNARKMNQNVSNKPQRPIRGNRSSNEALVDTVNQKVAVVINYLAYVQSVLEEMRILFDLLFEHQLLYANEANQFRQYLVGELGIVVQFPKVAEKKPKLVVPGKPKPLQPPQPLSPSKAGAVAVVSPSKQAVPTTRKLEVATDEEITMEIRPGKEKDDDEDMPIVQNVIKKNMPPPPVPPLRRSARYGMSKEKSSPSEESCYVTRTRTRRASSSSQQSNDKSGAQTVIDPTTPLEMMPLDKIKTEPEDDEIPIVAPPPSKKKKTEEVVPVPGPSGSGSKAQPKATSGSGTKTQSKASPKAAPKTGKNTLKIRCLSTGIIKEGHTCDKEKCQFQWACAALSQFLDVLMSYEMLPKQERERNGAAAHPSAFFGLQHLLRFMILLPVITDRAGLPVHIYNDLIEELYEIYEFLDVNNEKIVDADSWYKPEPNNAVTMDEISLPVKG